MHILVLVPAGRKSGTPRCPGHPEVTMDAGATTQPSAEPDGCPDAATLPPPGACRASEVLGRVGDKWSLQVIFSLGEGPKGITGPKRGVEGISQRMLAVTLRGLERDGIVTRTMYPVMPPRVDYTLTPMGRTLLHVACTLIGWVHDHLDEID